MLIFTIELESNKCLFLRKTGREKIRIHVAADAFFNLHTQGQHSFLMDLILEFLKAECGDCPALPVLPLYTRDCSGLVAGADEYMGGRVSFRCGYFIEQKKDSEGGEAIEQGETDQCECAWQAQHHYLEVANLEESMTANTAVSLKGTQELASLLGKTLLFQSRI